jgi:protein SCO1/2
MSRRLAAAVIVLGAACGPRSEVRQHELTGQVLAVRPERNEIVIRHEDIPGLMPGMTMPFRVRERRWLDGLVPGALVRARLVLDESGPYLAEVHPTGRTAPLPETTEAPTVMDPPIEPGAALPDVSLIDQLGRRFSLRDLRGAAFALTFTYTRCPLPTYCPAQDRRFADLQAAIRRRSDLSGRRLLSISIDPEHDRPEVLAAHAERLGADPAIWRFATGDRTDILRFASSLALSVIVEDAASADLVHSVRTAVVDSEGRLVRRYDGTGWQATDLLQDLAGAR